MKKEEEYLRQTELRRAANYNQRRNAYEQSGMKDWVSDAGSCGLGCIYLIIAFFGICLVVGIIIAIFGG